MPFQYKTKEDFSKLNHDKKCYYLARLYIATDELTPKTAMPYQKRLFSCVNFLKQMPWYTLSILYNYLTDNKHNGVPISVLIPIAQRYEEERKRKEATKNKPKEYDKFSMDLLDEILEGK